MSAAQTTADAGRVPRERRNLEDLLIPNDQYSYAFGYISSGHRIAIERLDALLARPGDKRSLLKTLGSIRNDLAEEVENLRGHLERRAALPAAKTGGAV